MFPKTCLNMSLEYLIGISNLTCLKQEVNFTCSSLYFPISVSGRTDLMVAQAKILGVFLDSFFLPSVLMSFSLASLIDFTSQTSQTYLLHLHDPSCPNYHHCLLNYFHNLLICLPVSMFAQPLHKAANDIL